MLVTSNNPELFEEINKGKSLMELYTAEKKEKYKYKALYEELKERYYGRL